MTEQLTPDVRELLAAMRDALDVPLAAAGDDLAERQYVRLLELRFAILSGALNAALDQAAAPHHTASAIRQGIAETPITYTVYTPTGKGTSGADQAPAGESTQADTCPGCGDTVEWVRDPATGRRECPNCTTDAPEHTAPPEIVAFRRRDGRHLRCPAHAPAPSLIGLDWAPVTGLEVDGDDSRCTECGTDVLADHAPDACGRCRRPFDPADTRWDGRGRHGDTPWCRRCIDRCHDSTDAFHRCVICDPGAYATGGGAR